MGAKAIAILNWYQRSKTACEYVIQEKRLAGAASVHTKQYA
jgi:hypothetical protein